MTNKLYKLMNWADIEEVIYAESDNPHRILGPHKSGTKTLVQAYFPGAESVNIHYLRDDKRVRMEVADEDGFFAALVIGATKDYEYEVTYPKTEKDWRAKTLFLGEPYRFDPLITAEDEGRFGKGIHYSIYELLGAHPMTLDGVKGTYFAVWAPNAMRVSVVGELNDWDGRMYQMRKLPTSGIFEIFLPGVKAGDAYLYEIKEKNGRIHRKADPYATAMKLDPTPVSVVCDIDSFEWNDMDFVEEHALRCAEDPMSVYEVCLSDYTAKDGTPMNYREIAAALVDEGKRGGYTHVELLPIMEYLDDATRGFGTIGYYAPTSRYGSSSDFAYLVGELHREGIGVILDWTPAHFPKDELGLARFDGTCLYEHEDPRQGIHPIWGTCLYNYGRPEVSNFLIANALFWTVRYHVDGIRMDGVASMLYLDYGKQNGGWIPNLYGGNENLDAIEWMKHLNSILKKTAPGTITASEGSSLYPQMTASLSEGGLGFDLKQNKGFATDLLDYLHYDPIYRSAHHRELTLSMVYAYTEHFELALSHEELPKGMDSMYELLPGDEEQKKAAMRLAVAYLFTHPGKKLLYTGKGSFAGRGEDETLIHDLNQLYQGNPALYALDGDSKGFEWLNNLSANENMVSFVRHGKEPEELLVVVANFSGAPTELRTGVPYEGRYKEILNTDDKKYGGSGFTNPRVKNAEDVEWDGRRQSISLKLAAQSLSILQFIPYTEEQLEKVIAERIRKHTPILKSKKGKKS